MNNLRATSGFSNQVQSTLIKAGKGKSRYFLNHQSMNPIPNQFTQVFAFRDPNRPRPSSSGNRGFTCLFLLVCFFALGRRLCVSFPCQLASASVLTIDTKLVFSFFMQQVGDAGPTSQVAWRCTASAKIASRRSPWLRTWCPFDSALLWHGPSLRRAGRQVKRNSSQLPAKPQRPLWSLGNRTIPIANREIGRPSAARH
jgi:hypothetical protein